MEIYHGRPADENGRLSREIRTYDFLDQLGISYQRTDHERADHMEACNVIDAVLDVVICKNLFLCNRQKTAFYLLMMPGGKKFRTKNCLHRFIPPGSPLRVRKICLNTWILNRVPSASWG